MKVQKKRTKPIEKAWYILSPFIIYMVVKTMAMIFLSLVMSSLPQENAVQWIEQHTDMVPAVVNALASIAGVAFIMRDFLAEIASAGEVDIDKGAVRQLYSWVRYGIKKNRDHMLPIGAAISLGITAAITLNAAISFLGVESEKYNQVEQIQYSVPIWLGLILYGLISPIVEEIVFRGLTYNRMRRYYGKVVCVIITSGLFGGFHGNLPQTLYGMGMGILMVLCYEWTGCFGAPVLFHMAANICIFLLSGVPLGYSIFSSPLYCTVFAVISVGLMIYLHHTYTKRSLS